VNHDEVKVVLIGESGCGKSTLIRHLSKNPNLLKNASSKDGHAGTTKVTVEYLLGEYDKIQVKSVYCFLNNRDNLSKLTGNAEFDTYLTTFEELQTLDKYSDEFLLKINYLATEYLKNLDINKVFELVNKQSVFFNRIVLTVPINEDLLKEISNNNYKRLRIVDTRGIGDEDQIERVIPFAGADAIMIVGKHTGPSPFIMNGLTKVCENYKHIPILFIGSHQINEDEVDISSSNTIDEYLNKLVMYNNNSNCQIKKLYADVFENQHNFKLIPPVQAVMNECRINHIPYIKSLAIPTSEQSKYFKFYVPACIHTFSNCIKTIRSYQNAHNDVSNLLLNSTESIYKELNSKNIVEVVVNYLTIEPQQYDWFVDFDSVAKGIPQRRSPLSYSINCVSATLYSMLNYAINNVKFSNNDVSNDILNFFFKRLLDHNSNSWYWGYDSGYYYNIIDFCEVITDKCKRKLRDRENPLYLDSVIATRHSIKYDSKKSIKILLFEESLLYLINKIGDNSEIKTFLSNSLDIESTA